VRTASYFEQTGRDQKDGQWFCMVAELDPLEPDFVGSRVAAEEDVVGGLSEGNLTRYMGVAGGGLDVENELAMGEFAVELATDVFSGFGWFFCLRLSARPSRSHI
jgi:hypothetical protein